VPGDRNRFCCSSAAGLVHCNSVARGAHLPRRTASPPHSGFHRAVRAGNRMPCSGPHSQLAGGALFGLGGGVVLVSAWIASGPSPRFIHRAHAARDWMDARRSSAWPRVRRWPSLRGTRLSRSGCSKRCRRSFPSTLSTTRSAVSARTGRATTCRSSWLGMLPAHRAVRVRRIRGRLPRAEPSREACTPCRTGTSCWFLLGLAGHRRSRSPCEAVARAARTRASRHELGI